MSKILDYLQIKKMRRKKSWVNLDKASIIDKDKAIGLKNISIAENYFRGHFPERKVMPGILQLELMVETACVLNLYYGEYVPYELSSMKKIRFKRPIVPGCQVLFEVERIEDIEENVSHFRAKSMVGGQVCALAEFVIKKVNIVSLSERPFENHVIYDKKEEDKISMSVEEIFKDIPHRDPFLFVEKVCYFSEKEMVSEKFITNNDPYMSEFPDEGYLYLSAPYLFEIGAQYYLSVTNMIKDNLLERTTPLFVSIEEVKLHRVVLPGEVLSFDLKVIFFKVGIAKASMLIQSNGENIAEGFISCAFIKK